MKRLLVGFLLAVVSFAVSAVGTVNAFRIFPDRGGFASYIRLAPTYTDARGLAANVAEAHTIPTGAKYVIFAATCAAFYALLD